MESINLFGEMQEMDRGAIRGKYKHFKAHTKYRLGTPEKSCKNCRSCIKKEYHNKTYYKCEFMGDSNGEASDIRLKNVCDWWKI